MKRRRRVTNFGPRKQERPPGTEKEIHEDLSTPPDRGPNYPESFIDPEGQKDEGGDTSVEPTVNEKESYGDSDSE